MAVLDETCSGGGPIIAIPAELAHLWRGTDPPEGVDVPEGWSWGAGDIVCDYDRACDEVRDLVQTDYGGVGWLQVGQGRALILDAELVTAIAPTDHGGVIIRNYEEEELTTEDAAAVVGRVAAESWSSYAQTFTLTDGRLFLFDSAYPGATEADAIEADDGVAVGALGPGTYRVDIASLDGIDRIRLTRV